MLNKLLSLFVILGLVATANLSVLAQSSKVKNFQQSDVLLKFGIDPAERADRLLDGDYLTKVRKDSLPSKAMQDASNAKQKKKFVGIGTTTAIVIGAVLVTAIIIVLANKGNKSDNNPCLSEIGRGPCPPGCFCTLQ